MFNKIKKIIANKKGMSTIEFAISLMVFIMLFSFIFDLILITYKQYAVAEQTTQMVRQIAKQSGCTNSTPYNFPGGAENYYTTTELYNIMKKKMDNLNIPEGDWSVTIKTTDKSQPVQNQNRLFILTPTHSGLNTNYGNYIAVETTYNYTWGLWSQFMPTKVKGQMVVERGAFAEYNHDLSK